MITGDQEGTGGAGATPCCEFESHTVFCLCSKTKKRDREEPEPTTAKRQREEEYTVEPKVSIPDELYDQMMQQIQAMPEKKRKNWTWPGGLTNKHGVKSKVRYRDGQIENYQGKDR